MTTITTTAGLKVWPSAADAIPVTSGGGNSVLGAWVEIIPAHTISSPIAIAGLCAEMKSGSTGGSDNLEIQFGTGQAGVEAAITKPILVSAGAGNLSFETWMLPAPIGNIPANARLSMRTRSTSTSVTYPFALMYYDALDPSLATVTPYFYAPYSNGSTTQGASSTPNATPWALSAAWSEFHPGLPAGTQLLGIGVQYPGAAYNGVEFEVLLAAGEESSEVAITTIPGIFSDSSAEGFMDFWLPQSYTLQVAARISYKLRKSGTTTDTFKAFLIGLLAQPSPPSPPMPPPNPPVITSLDLNCDLNQLGINGTDFAEGMVITVEGPSGQQLAFSILSLAPTRIVLTIIGFQVLSGVYCVNMSF